MITPCLSTSFDQSATDPQHRLLKTQSLMALQSVRLLVHAAVPMNSTSEHKGILAAHDVVLMNVVLYCGIQHMGAHVFYTLSMSMSPWS